MAVSQGSEMQRRVEPPYGIIWNRLKAGKVIAFLGAGASFVGLTADAQ